MARLAYRPPNMYMKFPTVTTDVPLEGTGIMEPVSDHRPGLDKGER